MRALWLLALVAPLAASGKEPPLPADLPAFGPDRPLVVPAIQRSTTPEGLTVWLVPRPGLPKVSMVLGVRGGTASDPAGLQGSSEILAKVLLEGTASHTAQQIAEAMQDAGGELNALAQEDTIFVEASGLSRSATEIVRTLADVARNASFPAGEVALAKANALQEWQVKTSQPRFLAQRALGRSLFGAHPYHVVGATPEVIEAVTPEALRQVHRQRFRPDRALLVVVGDFDAAALRTTIGKESAGWKGEGEAPTPAPAPAAKARELVLVPRPGSVQTEYLLGHVGPRPPDPGYIPLMVAVSVFGDGFGSRLVRNIREEKGYTYTPFSRVRPMLLASTLTTGAAVRSEVTGPALVEILYELDRMATMAPPEPELDRAKRLMAGRHVMLNQSQMAVAMRLAGYWSVGLPPEMLAEWVDRVKAVTPSDVLQASRANLASRLQSIVAVGDPAVEAELRVFGSVEVRAP
jgi:predicted Zn-dependent peptidase